MSWMRQVRTLYTISLLMLFYILWAIIGFFLLAHMETRYTIYLVWLVSVFLMQFLKSKTRNMVISLFIPGVVGLLLVYYVTKEPGAMVSLTFLLNLIMTWFLIFLFLRMDKEEIDYNLHKKRMKYAVQILAALGLLIPWTTPQVTSEVLRFYILFLISVVIVLREVRLYFFEIRNKKSFYVNIIVIISMILVSIQQVSAFIVKILGAVYNGVATILTFIFTIIGVPIAYLFSGFKLDYLDAVSKKVKPLLGAAQGGSGDKAKIKDAPVVQNLHVSPYVKVAIGILILFIIYRIFVKGTVAKENKSPLDQREKLAKEAKPRLNPLRAIQRLLKGNSIKEHILFTYRKFEHRTSGKGIFQTSMTANELKEETKPLVSQKDDLASLTDIYNEAKFSDHSMDEDKLKVIQDNYNTVKKELQSK